MTGKQILWAVENGFIGIEIQTQKLLDSSEKSLEQERIVKASIAALKKGKSIIIHTAIGTNDPRYDLMKQKVNELSLTYKKANEILGDVLGEIALKIIQSSNIKRFVIAGGDTSGRIQKSLSIQALQVAKPIGIASPLCYVYSSIPIINGVEIAFKGGQIGSIDYFRKAQIAKTREFEAAALGSF